MATDSEAEADLLGFAAEELRERGYTVVLEPSPATLPVVLKDLHPDGIAIGKKPYLLIEVAKEGNRSAERVHKLQRAIEDAADWRLHLILDRGIDPAALGSASLDDIRQTLGRIRQVAGEDARAGLLMCWACLEALSRAFDPKGFARPQTPGRLVERLASSAYITASEAQFLRSMAQRRNEFVHGQLATVVDRSDIERFLELLGALLELESHQSVT